jgi:hypothetical protein
MASAAKHQAQLVRFRNGNDIVTSVPKGGEFEHVGELAHLTGDNGVFKVSLDDLPYGGLGSLADHDIAGWAPRPKKAVSGYYRRVLAISKQHPQTCAPVAAVTPPPPAVPVALEPPVKYPARLDCAKAFPGSAFTSALGEKAPLTIRDERDPESTARCSLIRGGTKLSAAEQQKLLKQNGRLGLLPGDVVCEVTAYCYTIEDPARFEASCAKRGDKFADGTCTQTIPIGAYDYEAYRFLDEDSKCVLSVRGGPANPDNDQVKRCASTARAAFGPAQLK